MQSGAVLAEEETTPEEAAAARPDHTHKAVGRLGRGSLAGFVGVLIAAVANFGVTIALTRGLSKTDAGVFFSCSSIFLLAVSIGQLGTSTSLVYFLSRARLDKDWAKIHGYLRTATAPVVIAGALSGLAMVLLASPLARLTNPDHVDSATLVLQILGVFTPIGTLKTLNLSSSRGFGTVRATVLIEQVIRPLLQLVLVAAAAFSGHLWLVPVAWGLPFLAGAASGRSLVRRFLPPEAQDVAPDRSVAREFWVFTWPRALSSVAQMAMQRFDIVLIGAIVGAAPAAIYAASTRFLVLGQMGNRAVSLSAQPRLAEALARQARGEVSTIYRTSTAWLMMTTWPAYLVLITAGSHLMQVFGHGYRGGAPLVTLLASAMLLSTGCGMVDMLLNMAGRTTWTMWNAFIAFGLNLGLDLLLLPRMGIMGAAVGWAVAIAVQNLLGLVQVRLSAGVHPFGPGSFIVAGASVLTFGLVPYAAQHLWGTGWSVVLGSVVLATLLYGAAVLAFRRQLNLAALLRGRRKGKAAGV